MVAINIYVLIGFNTNSSSADKREGTNLEYFLKSHQKNPIFSFKNISFAI